MTHVQPLMEAGIDSLGSVELHNTLGSQLNIELPATLIFDYPSIGALASFLTAHAQSADSSAPAADVVHGGFGPQEIASQLSSLVASVLGSSIPPNQVRLQDACENSLFPVLLCTASTMHCLHADSVMLCSH